MIKIAQIRAARAMLHLSQKEVASLANVSIATYNNIERGVQNNPHMNTLNAIKHAFEQEGIEFINENFGGIGVKLKTKKKNPNNPTILIVDDSKADRTLYKVWLGETQNTHYKVVEAADAAAGLDLFLKERPDCIILDFMMYGADGFQLLATMREEPVELPPIIFVTAMHNEILEESARDHGVYRYLNKQLMNKKDLCDAVAGAINM